MTPDRAGNVTYRVPPTTFTGTDRIAMLAWLMWIEEAKRRGFRG